LARAELVHNPDDDPTAEVLFAGFLDRIDAGEPADVEELCRRHPAHAMVLRRMHAHWAALSEAFQQISRDGSGAPGAASPSLSDLSARIGATGGRLARYSMRAEIARGAMGRIVRAWDEELRREVALKIQRGPLADARVRRRFLEEAQIVAQLDHPGIVPIHEVGVDVEGRPFFAMQLVRGHDLDKVLAALKAGDPQWPLARVLGVMNRVCDAMAFAHERGVVHRDLKPANIMVGRFGEAYVMDWGLAHVSGRGAASDAGAAVATVRQDIAAEEGHSPLLTSLGDVIGTPAYMAPEQAAGDGAVTTAVDVYSLGAILYHALAGEMPYATHAQSADAMLAAVRNGPPLPLPDDVPPELRAIQMRAMARAPADRYATVKELGADLLAFMEVRTVRAYATGPLSELRKWVMRNRAVAAIASVLVAMAAVSSIVMALLWMRADALRTVADEGAAKLQDEFDRSAFVLARQELRLDNSMGAGDALWHAHFAGRLRRATTWALREQAERDPYIAVMPDAEERWLAFAERSDQVLVGGLDGRLQIRAVPTLQPVAEIVEPGAALTAVAAIDDSLAVAGTTDGRVLWYDLAQRRVVRRVMAHAGSVLRLVAVGRGCVSGGADAAVRWLPSSDAEPQELFRLNGKVLALAAHADGSGAYAGDEDGHLGGAAFDGSWRLPARRIADSVTALAASADANRLWYGDGGNLLQEFDVRRGTSRPVTATRNGACRSLVEQRDGSLLIAGWWRTDRLSPSGTITPVALRPVRRIALSPDERWLVTSNRISGIGVVDLRPMERRAVDGAVAAGLSQDGRRLAARKAGNAAVMDLATGATVGQVPIGGDGRVALDHDGRRLAAIVSPNELHVYDVASGARRFAAAGVAEGFAQTMQFRPGGDEIAMVAKSVRRLHADTGDEIAAHELPGPGSSLSYSGDGRFLAVLIRGRPLVRVFDLVGGGHRDEGFAGDWPATITPNLVAVALSHDGALLAVGNNNGPIRVRRRDGSTQALPGNGATVWSLQFTARDPQLLWVASGSHGIAAWDLESSACCCQVVHDHAFQLEVSADGDTLSCVTPRGGLAIDLAYRERHVAGSLPGMLQRLRGDVTIAPERMAELQAWSATVLARPWPRWR
jgi:tRNA A-37 threonylcarbamoyl transferase component Bud32/WD40 repeat protein